MAERVDAVVVGSGFGGCICTLRLAQDGRKVVVLERGARRHEQDFRQTQDPKYIAGLYRMLQTTTGDIVFRVANTLGGGSVVFSGAMLRSPSDVFELRDTEGRRFWPEQFSRSMLDPTIPSGTSGSSTTTACGRGSSSSAVVVTRTSMPGRRASSPCRCRSREDARSSKSGAPSTG